MDPGPPFPLYPHPTASASNGLAPPVRPALSLKFRLPSNVPSPLASPPPGALPQGDRPDQHSEDHPRDLHPAAARAGSSSTSSSMAHTRRGPPSSSSRARRASNTESEFEEPDEEDDDDFDQEDAEQMVSSRGRLVRNKPNYRVDEDDEEDEYERRENQRSESRAMRRFVEDDDEEDEDEDGSPVPRRKAFPARKTSRSSSRSKSNGKGRASSSNSRRPARIQDDEDEDEDDDPLLAGDFDAGAAGGYRDDDGINGTDNMDRDTKEGLVHGGPAPSMYVEVDEGEDEMDDDDDDQPVRSGRRVTRSVTAVPAPKPKGRQTRNSRKHVEIDAPYEEEEDEDAPAARTLRVRKSRPNYVLHPPSSEAAAPEGFGGAGGGGSSRSGGKSKSGKHGGSSRKGGGYNSIPWGSTGSQLSKHLGLAPPGGAGDDSDDDFNNATPRKTAASIFGPGMGGAAGAGGGMFGAPPLPLDMGTGPSNMGKVGDASLSDADPLGVKNVSFDSVGGLDHHIQQLKEMVSLPLLYPELFQRFNVTPPRGVLFHGPPGTGKTLVARALAASCSTGGTKISFFMRKGADCLSKWVGEAERQLRLLFEEARNCQPSIIFFDEIDGLAPVRSSKQDQIHASIVSTLLALMDGMDGRGQVIIIGATNRPDAVDPALRRPGRFDREFYFPLPNKTARTSILNIHTKGWEPPLGEAFIDNLAGLTKGYGGSDLRALCTEASLNAIQRRYPQIYKTNDRLVLNPESINVSAKDFMISVKNLIPSSARATASAAAPLPAQLVPLLSQSLQLATAAIDKALPPVKKRNVLEEAEFETDDPLDGTFEREVMLQGLEAMRVYRPRVLVYGEPGMGQNYIGAAILHHLEGFHVQSLDIGTLMGDSTRSIEAAIVQLFVEAKRHKPSVLYIPSLAQWSATMSEVARSTVKSLLDSLAPSDPVLLLAVVDGKLETLPKDVKAWFGYSKQNRVALTQSTSTQREAFFSELLSTASKPPNEFPDALPKRKRVLEVLEVAPPLPVRGPTQAELAAQLENDKRLREHLKWRLGPVLSELKRKHKRLMRGAQDDLDLYNQVVEDYDAYVLQIETLRTQARLEAALAGPAPDVQAAVGGMEVDLNVPGPSNHGVEVAHTNGNGLIPDIEVYLPPGDGPAPTSPIVLIPVPTSNSTSNDSILLGSSSVTAPSSVPAPPHGDVPASPVAEAPIVREPTIEELYPLPPIPRKPHDIDLEKMHSKLYYDRYLTPSQFLLDLVKIVENAELDVGDLERLWKAKAMLNQAELLVDSSCDAVFRTECEKMAGRERERAEARKKEKEERKDTEGKGKGKEREVEPTVAVEAEVTQDMADGGGDRGLKRAREDGAAAVTGGEGAAGDVEMGSPASKRLRPDDVAEDGTGLDLAQAVVPSPTHDHSPFLVASSSASASVFGPTSTAALAPPPSSPPVHAPSPPPPVPHPPFHLPSLDSLSQLLTHSTAKWTIEQLEQLRAALLDIVWRARAAWDRTEAVQEMEELVREMSDEVEQEQREADD